MRTYRTHLLLAVVAVLVAGCGSQVAAPATVVPAPSPAPGTEGVPNTAAPALSSPIPAPAVPSASPAPPASTEPAPATAAPATATPLAWESKQFDTAWTLRYPQSWEVNTAGLHEGFVGLRGRYEDHEYEVSFAYPMLDPPFPQTLDEWVAQVLQGLPQEQRGDVAVSDVTVAGMPAKKLENVPDLSGQHAAPMHQAYIWKSGDTNPRLIIIQQIDGATVDRAQMARLFDEILAGVGAQ